MHAYRTHQCGRLRASDVGQRVRLSGWVHRSRDHGGLLFIDLRDHYGLTQCVVEPDSPAFAAASEARSEWVLTVTGPVVARTPETVNPDIPTGEIEIRIETVEVQNRAGELPLPVFGDQEFFSVQAVSERGTFDEVEVRSYFAAGRACAAGLWCRPVGEAIV